MDKWKKALLEAEEMWEADSYSFSWNVDKEEYKRIRDTYKAERIYDLYGYDYFLKFVERCPHIQDYVNMPRACDYSQDAQCTFFCYYYKNGGCKDATK